MRSLVTPAVKYWSSRHLSSQERSGSLNQLMTENTAEILLIALQSDLSGKCTEMLEEYLQKAVAFAKADLKIAHSKFH